MKKGMLLLLGVLLLSALCVEIFIPSTLTITRTVPARCKAEAAFAVLSEETRWQAWWPDSTLRAGFHIQGLAYQTINIAIRQGEQVLDSRMSLLPLGNQDSLLLHWETQLHCGWNPVD